MGISQWVPVGETEGHGRHLLLWQPCDEAVHLWPDTSHELLNVGVCHTLNVKLVLEHKYHWQSLWIGKWAGHLGLTFQWIICFACWLTPVNVPLTCMTATCKAPGPWTWASSDCDDQSSKLSAVWGVGGVWISDTLPVCHTGPETNISDTAHRSQ